MTKHSPTRPARPSEQGYILLFAVFLTALLVIALAIAAPKVAKSIQRDKDLETYNRGLQYRRAIQLYYRKFNAYPPNADALVQTNNIRFLRKKYIDPITGKDDWKPILFGQNKVPTAMGFFGQPLAGSASTIAGIGPGSGADGILPGGISNLFGGGSSTDTSSTNSTNSSTGDSSNNGSSTDSSGNSSGTGTGGGTSSTGGFMSGSDQSGQNGQTGLNGQTFGGGGIIGFKPPSEKKSILVYKKKDHYNEWEFTYDPISDMQMMSGGNTGNALGNGNNGQPGSNTNSPFGSPTFGPGSNNSNGIGGNNSNGIGGTINQNNLSGPPGSN